MKALLQRVQHASVTVDGQLISQIGPGLLVLLGVGPEDTEKEAAFLADKAARLRIFQDENDKMNLSLLDVDGEMLVVSQFTLYADLKSRRPFPPPAAKGSAPPLPGPLLQLMPTLSTRPSRPASGNWASRRWAMASSALT